MCVHSHVFKCVSESASVCVLVCKNILMGADACLRVYVNKCVCAIVCVDKWYVLMCYCVFTCVNTTLFE